MADGVVARDVTADHHEVVREALAGDRRALSRALSMVESGDGRFREVAPMVFAARRGSHSIGLTGAPGAGKSSLTDALVGEVRRHDLRAAVIAVDPSSPFTGGAILGDRVRLSVSNTADDGVFMRSLSNRGLLGGLSLAVPGMVALFDAADWPIVLIETVGVGQSELAIAKGADTTIVVVNPGWGDEVQANKSGLLEIADVLVVNKCDRDGADATVRDLERMLHLGKERAWTVPIVRTIATDGVGVDELWAAVGSHRRHLESSGELARRRADRRLAEVRERVHFEVEMALVAAERSSEGVSILDRLDRAEADPLTAAVQLMGLLRDQLAVR